MGDEPSAGAVDASKTVEPKVGVLEANGLEGVEEEKGFADDWPKGFAKDDGTKTDETSP